MRHSLDALERLIDSLVESGAASAAVALAGGPRRIEWTRAAGWARGGPAAGRQPAAAGTWFDFGSLTKPFVAALALALDSSGELPLGTRLGEVLAGAAPQLAARPLADMLRHRAGLMAWTPLYARCGSRAEVEALLLSGALLSGSSGGSGCRGRSGESGRGGSVGVYSDLDYLLWGLAAERSLGKPLAALVAGRVLAPLDLAGEVAVMPGDRPQVAESRMGTGREVELAARQGVAAPLLPPPPLGLPQDGNARFLAALAAPDLVLPGHSGLFGTAAALWRLGAEWLEPRVLLHNEAVAAALAGGGPFALGWWRRRVRGGGGGPALSAGSFGHTGFAGGSLWIDPPWSRIFVLLAHRLDPASDMNRWRRRFHAAAVRAFSQVRVGGGPPGLGVRGRRL
jgi:CubicO group peptidase (beta-lactamase class C family)